MFKPAYTKDDNRGTRKAYSLAAPDTFLRVIAIRNVLRKADTKYPDRYCFDASNLAKDFAGLELRSGIFDTQQEEHLRLYHNWNFDPKTGYVVDITAQQFNEFANILGTAEPLFVKIDPEKSEKEVLAPLGYEVDSEVRVASKKGEEMYQELRERYWEEIRIEYERLKKEGVGEEEEPQKKEQEKGGGKGKDDGRGKPGSVCI